jgi:hypothetical protein
MFLEMTLNCLYLASEMLRSTEKTCFIHGLAVVVKAACRFLPSRLGLRPLTLPSPICGEPPAWTLSTYLHLLLLLLCLASSSGYLEFHLAADGKGILHLGCLNWPCADHLCATINLLNCQLCSISLAWLACGLLLVEDAGHWQTRMVKHIST